MAAQQPLPRRRRSGCSSSALSSTATAAGAGAGGARRRCEREIRPAGLPDGLGLRGLDRLPRARPRDLPGRPRVRRAGAPLSAAYDAPPRARCSTRRARLQHRGGRSAAVRRRRQRPDPAARTATAPPTARPSALARRRGARGRAAAAPGGRTRRSAWTFGHARPGRRAAPRRARGRAGCGELPRRRALRPAATAAPSRRPLRRRRAERERRPRAQRHAAPSSSASTAARWSSTPGTYVYTSDPRHATRSARRPRTARSWSRARRSTRSTRRGSSSSTPRRPRRRSGRSPRERRSCVSHDGYRRLPQRVVHRRRFRLDRLEDKLEITDRLVGEATVGRCRRVPLAAGSEVSREAGDTVVRTGTARSASSRGAEAPNVARGWVSCGFGRAEPAPVLELGISRAPAARLRQSPDRGAPVSAAAARRLLAWSSRTCRTTRASGRRRASSPRAATQRPADRAPLRDPRAARRDARGPIDVIEQPVRRARARRIAPAAGRMILLRLWLADPAHRRRASTTATTSIRRPPCGRGEDARRAARLRRPRALRRGRAPAAGSVSRVSARLSRLAERLIVRVADDRDHDERDARGGPRRALRPRRGRGRRQRPPSPSSTSSRSTPASRRPGAALPGRDLRRGACLRGDDRSARSSCRGQLRDPRLRAATRTSR